MTRSRVFVPRGARRTRGRFPAEVKSFGLHHDCQGVEFEAIDLSALGAGLLAPIPIMPGRRVRIKLAEEWSVRGEPGWKFRTFTGRVANLKREPVGFRIGVAFDNPLAGPDISYRIEGQSGVEGRLRIDGPWESDSEPTEATEPETEPGNAGRGASVSPAIRLFKGAAWGALAIDQLTKAGAPALRDPLHNTGFLGGFLGGKWAGNLLNVLVCTLLMTLVAQFARRSMPRWRRPEALGWALFWAGVMGNMIDRVMLGYVRDFLPVPFTTNWYCNLADVSTVVGLAIVIAASGTWRLVDRGRPDARTITS